MTKNQEINPKSIEISALRASQQQNSVNFLGTAREIKSVLKKTVDQNVVYFRFLIYVYYFALLKMIKNQEITRNPKKFRRSAPPSNRISLIWWVGRAK